MAVPSGSGVAGPSFEEILRPLPPTNSFSVYESILFATPAGYGCGATSAVSEQLGCFCLCLREASLSAVGGGEGKRWSSTEEQKVRAQKKKRERERECDGAIVECN